jgi:hypothetical protein
MSWLVERRGSATLAQVPQFGLEVSKVVDFLLKVGTTFR